MEQISISEIQRNLHTLDNFDIIEVIDKKRNTIKGYFIESKYASFVEEISKKVEERKKQNRKSLRGVLSSYADVKKIEEEAKAWKNHVFKKYGIDD
jgi:tRNA U34 5-carboxymethylaminomethyl modifying enzyme MnmG/GidA